MRWFGLVNLVNVEGKGNTHTHKTFEHAALFVQLEKEAENESCGKECQSCHDCF